jgi:hypothetical protein
MAPSINQLRAVDPILTDYSIAYSQEPRNLVAPVLFPDKQVAGETGTYYIHDANQRFRHYPTYRADGAEAVSIKWRVTSATFGLDEYAAKTDVTERQRNNALDPMEIDQDAATVVTDAILLDKELRARNLILPATLVWETTVSVMWDQSTATREREVEVHDADDLEEPDS